MMSKSMWSHRPPIIKWTIKASRDQRTGAISPIKPSRYFKYLSEIGAGWEK